MADNLPLIPSKREAVCADVKPVLQEVFREDHLPPLALERTKATVEEQLWIDNYKSECEEIWKQEGDLKKEFAKRISKKRKSNLYKLFSPKQKMVTPWKLEKGMIGREDLMPAIEQNAEREKSLWVQNILNRSSCQFSTPRGTDHKLAMPLDPLCPDAWSLQTLSYGELGLCPQPPTPLELHPPPEPEYIICVPPQLDFVNFTLGHVHTHQLRFVNVSKFEARLSVTPPRHRELDVQLCGSRGLSVSSGSTAEFKVHFRPRDVRTLREKLRVRVSIGKNLVIPIACYMQPPILHILVPNIASSLSYVPDRDQYETPGGDILDLGSRLLGDVHCIPLLLQSTAAHATFFLVTGDAWITYTMEELTSAGSLATGPFIIHPAWWAGGGQTRGFARCHAPFIGLHTAALRILSSTATTRTLHVLADSLYFTPDHITIQAHQKDYDICSQDDPDCGYYVHLGTAFPNRSLSTTVHLINNSPVPYSFYWSVRPWGVCSCWQDELASQASMVGEDDDSDRLCPGAKESKVKGDQTNAASATSVQAIRIQPTAGGAGARSSCTVHVCVPDVGAALGTQRAVLLLILKDIPKESFPLGLDPMIVRTRTVEAQVSPGVGKSWSKEVCEVVCAQMEVWWEVVPVRFVLDPPVLPLPHSRRVTSVRLSIRATQLFGVDDVRTRWRAPPWPAPPAPRLTPAHSVDAALLVPLPPLPNDYPETDIVTLTTDTEEWMTACRLERACATRHPALAPARAWLGVVPPRAHVATAFKVINDTIQHICWWATPYRWWGENRPSAACAGVDVVPCAACCERACTCALVSPGRGALPHGASQAIRYDVNAPTDDPLCCVGYVCSCNSQEFKRIKGGYQMPFTYDGFQYNKDLNFGYVYSAHQSQRDTCVATLLQVRRTAPDAAFVPGGPGTAARASLVAYRVLAPNLVLRVFPCAGDKKGACERCDLDPGAAPAPRGGAVLRPRAALAAGRRSCYHLRVTNLTPIPTTVRWEPPAESDEVLKVEFIPNDFDIGSYAEITIQVVLAARRVCGRRLFVQRAKVTHAYKPLYLLIDAAIDGVKIVLEIPLGGAEKTDSFLELRGTQREVFPWDSTNMPLTPEECFEAEDRKRAERIDKCCHCRYKMVYIPPPKEDLMPLEEGDYYPPELLLEPPPLTRICPCCNKTRPVIVEHEHPYCLQYENIPLRTVRTRRLLLRNAGELTARWRAEVRRWPRVRDHAATTEALTVGKDRWAGDVRAPGVALQCEPSSGVCAAGATAAIDVAVFADCWGCYCDQLLIMVEGVEPIVLDVWVEAAGPPLQFALAPAGDAGADAAYDALMWLSSSDPERTLRARNTSRARLTVHAYALLEHEYAQDEWPFRLYMRFFDVFPRTCPCLTDHPSDEICGEASTASSSLSEEMDTGVDVFFTADHGPQDYEYYIVEPQVCTVEAGACAEWRVALAPGRDAPAPRGLLLLRTIPDDDRGSFWRRGEPVAARAALRSAPRESALRVAVREVRARLCALDLPYKDVARVRKRFRIQNTGSAPLALRCATSAPWSAVLGEPRGGCTGCGCERERGDRVHEVELALDPWSSTAMCVEVCVDAAEVWPEAASEPCAPAAYEPHREFTATMEFYGDQMLLQRLPLVLEVEFPKIHVQPTSFNFGFVTDGDTRKTYFTVWHSSLTATMSVSVKWHGGLQFKMFPQHVRLAPGARQRVYLQYTARWSGAPVPAEGCARIMALAGAGAWCAATVAARAEPSRDHKFKAPPHDYTDDTHLFAPTN